MAACVTSASAARPVPSAAATASPDRAELAAIEDAGGQIAAHRVEAGLQVLTPIIARLEQQVAALRGKGDVYCADSQTESLAYLMGATTGGRSATVIGPQLCRALFYKAYAMTELGRKDEAVATLERLTALAPMNPHYFVELGYAYRVQGRPDQSRAAYQHAVDFADMAGDAQQTRRDRAAARRGLGYLLIDTGDLKGAEQLYRQSLQDDPDSPVAKSELAFIAKQRAK